MCEIGDRLKLLRNQRKLLQEELAHKLGVSKSAIGMYERNERHPNLAIMNRIADFFDVTTDYLLGKSDEPRLTETQYLIGRKKYHELVNLMESLDPDEYESVMQRVRDFVDGLQTGKK